MKKTIKKIFNKIGFDIISKYQLERNDVYIHKIKLLENKDIDVIFDVGAAMGEFTMKYHKMFPSAKIYAFEPRVEDFQHLQKHLFFCQPENIALSDVSGESDFFITASTPSSSLFRPLQNGNPIEKYTEIKNETKIITDTIDNFCEKNEIERISLLKMDTQGAELKILKGAARLLEKQLIDVIYSEVLFMKIYEEQPFFHNIALYLEKYNYTLYNLYNCVYQNNSKLIWADAIFVKNK